MLSIRAATPQDASLLRTLIRELADYERGLDQVTITEAEIIRDGFGPHRKFRAVIAEWNGNPEGYALFCEVYSTWRGSAALYLEDLFVRPSARGKGIGKALVAYVAAVARDEKCYGVRWEVLDWNKLAIDFYKAIGSEFRNEWKSVLLTREPLQRLASEAK